MQTLSLHHFLHAFHPPPSLVPLPFSINSFSCISGLQPTALLEKSYTHIIYLFNFGVSSCHPPSSLLFLSLYLYKLSNFAVFLTPQKFFLLPPSFFPPFSPTHHCALFFFCPSSLSHSWASHSLLTISLLHTLSM